MKTLLCCGQCLLSQHWLNLSLLVLKQDDKALKGILGYADSYLNQTNKSKNKHKIRIFLK